MTYGLMVNDLVDKAGKHAKDKGFHDKELSIGEALMLVVSELSEALEAARNGRWAGKLLTSDVVCNYSMEKYEALVRGTVEEEIADAVIRLADFCFRCGIDLEWHIKEKMEYNKRRPHLHGKEF